MLAIVWQKMAFSKLSFYGKRKNTDRNGERRWQERLQKITKLEAQWKANPHPKEYRPRITDPCILRKTFFRQKDAFDYARSKSEDLHVFAYESASLSKENTGQRMYMVCSYPHFWHYYSQMMKKSSCHHYEVIPEGAVCKLYFDLEFKRELNPGSDGDKMIITFVKLMNFHLHKHYGITCHENRIVDLEATTPTKFSRHLIFLLEGAAFKDNIHAGNFVHHVCAELLEAINTGSGTKLPDLTKKPKTSEETESKSSELPASGQPGLMQGPKPEVSKSESSELPGIQGVEQENSSAAEQGCQKCFSSCSNEDISEKVLKEGHDAQVFGVCDENNRTMSKACDNIDRTDDSSNIKEDKTEEVGFEGQTSGHVVGESCESGTGSEDALGNVINIEKDCIKEVDASGNCDSCNNGCEKCGSETGIKRNDPSENTTDKDSFSTCPCDREEDGMSSDACFGIPKSDLEKLLVKDGHGREVLFCDLAVYTKNRNFRLFQSSKLGKNNPLRYKRKPLLYRPSVSTGRTPGEQIFTDSLIANVRFDSYLRILTWEDGRLHYGGQGSKLSGTSARDKSAAPLEGYSSSPYPEIDQYIQRLLNKDGIQGSIRRWSYFSQGELLLYEISKYRWCGNVRRHHKSNNIMFLVDLQRGVYYQKCHDPECKQTNYKSEDKEIPKHLLPGYFFQEFEDDFPDISDRELSEAMDTYLPSARSVESCKTKKSSDELENAENIGLVVKQDIPKGKVTRTVGAEAAWDDFEIDDSALIAAMDTTENV